MKRVPKKNYLQQLYNGDNQKEGNLETKENVGLRETIKGKEVYKKECSRTVTIERNV